MNIDVQAPQGSVVAPVGNLPCLRPWLRRRLRRGELAVGWAFGVDVACGLPICDTVPPRRDQSALLWLRLHRAEL